MTKGLRKHIDELTCNKDRMCIITINLPVSFLKYISIMTEGDDRTYPSRSEFIRMAVRDKLKEELLFLKELQNIEKQYDEVKVIETGEVIRIPK